MSSVELRDDERALLADSGRCPGCGHLDVLHNYHCCTFCTLDDCPCEWISEDDDPTEAREAFERLKAGGKRWPD